MKWFRDALRNFYSSNSSCNNMFCLNIFHTQKHFSPTGSSVCAAAVSQHACFDGFYAHFRVSSPLCLLRHWAMWFFSQWNPILLLYSQECFSPSERQGVFTSLCLFLKSIHLRLQCLLTLSLWMRSNTCHMSSKTEHTPFPGRVSEGFSLQPGALVIVVADVK